MSNKLTDKKKSECVQSKGEKDFQNKNKYGVYIKAKDKLST